MRALKRILKWAGSAALFLVLAAALMLVASYLRRDRTFDSPLPALEASRDSAVIARGRYLVHGPAHCADCHGATDAKEIVEKGGEAPLTGGYTLRIFLGEMRAPNLTSDSVTGIGAVSDGHLARFLRTGIDRNGRFGLPVMQYPGLSDADLRAIISYLRTLPPVTHAVPASSYNPLGVITKAWFLQPFAPPSEAPPEEQPREPSVAWGAYLANEVATCAACHTARNMKTGEFTGPPFAGGLVLRNAVDANQVTVSPNLTPDSATGIITKWSREVFVARMRAGNLRPWSPMPWGPFGRMSDLDLESLYLYLRSLAPVNRANPLPQ